MGFVKKCVRVRVGFCGCSKKSHGLILSNDNFLNTSSIYSKSISGFKYREGAVILERELGSSTLRSEPLQISL
jgi:hypothetical protein